MATTFPIRANTQPAVRDIDQLIAALRKTAKEAGIADDRIEEMVKEAKRAGTDGTVSVNKLNKELGGLTGTLTSVAKGFAAMVAVDKIVDIGRKVIEVRAEFEKLSAVLTNTLGSQSRAQDALRMIQEIAAKTPFSVLQLTQSYVKLVNQGFKPASAELIKLGDLAASTGKEFDQLTEALIDAQVGEFERLKEFGIRASKEGDKVTFTFKGVKQQVDFTEDSIQKYILSLGDLEGVSGAMAAISETLGGKISNLGDSFDRLYNSAGEFLSPALGGIIDDLNNMIAILTDENLGKFDRFASLMAYANPAFAVATSGARGDLAEMLAKQRELIAAEKERLIVTTVNAALASDNVEAYIRALDQNINKEEIIARIREAQAKKQKEIDAEAVKGADERLKRLKELEGATFELSGQDEKMIALYRQQAAEVEAYNNQVKELLASLDRINARQKESALPDLSGLADGLEPESLDVGQLKSIGDIEAQKQDLRQQTYNHAIALGNALLDFERRKQQAELDMLRYRYEQEIFLAGDNEDSKDKIKQEFNKKQQELANEQAKRENQQAIFSILVNQGPAVAKTIGQSGFPAALPLLLLVAAQFALLLGNQRRIQPPRFASDGEFGIDGPGTTKSDSIPYMLSREESVVQAERSNKFKALLKPLIENNNFDWADARAIINKHLPHAPAPAILVGHAGTDSNELIKEMRATRKAIENKRETRFSFDENGFGYWVGRQDSWIKYLKGKYTM